MAKDKQTGINPLVAGAAGAAIGAGIAVAATKVMSDEKTRQKIANAASDVKDKVTELRVQAQKKASSLTSADSTPKKRQRKAK